MPTLILVYGPIASRKSSICSRLLKKRKFTFVDRANMKEMLKPIGKEEAKEIADKTTIFMVKELMKQKKDILVQEQNRKNLQKAVNDYGKGYKTYSFFLKCRYETAIARDKLREKKLGDPANILTNYNRVKYDKKDIIIDTEKNSIVESVKIILDKIKN